MLICSLNISFDVFMHDQSLLLLVSVIIYSLSDFLSVARQRVWAALAQILPHQERIAQSGEGRLYLPL